MQTSTVFSPLTQPLPQPLPQPPPAVAAKPYVSSISTRKTARRKHDPNIHKSAIKLLLEIPGVTENDLHQSLFTLRLIRNIEDVYDDICDYVKNSQDHGYGMKVDKIFRIIRKNQIEFEHDSDMDGKRRMMLWHGTQTQFVSLILINGFQRPPPNKQMFGTGIYFADRASKSANYCKSTKPGDVGYMFLCDVFVGSSYVCKNAHTGYTAPPTSAGKSGNVRSHDSVKCAGQYIPDPKVEKVTSGSIFPLGKTVKNDKFPSYILQRNEYIVYDPEQIRAKYLVKIVFQVAPV